MSEVEVVYAYTTRNKFISIAAANKPFAGLFGSVRTALLPYRRSQGARWRHDQRNFCNNIFNICAKVGLKGLIEKPLRRD